MNHPLNLPRDLAAAADMARRLRTMYDPPQELVVQMAVSNYLRRMRELRSGRLVPQRPLTED